MDYDDAVELTEFEKQQPERAAALLATLNFNVIYRYPYAQWGDRWDEAFQKEVVDRDLGNDLDYRMMMLMLMHEKEKHTNG